MKRHYKRGAFKTRHSNRNGETSPLVNREGFDSLTPVRSTSRPARPRRGFPSAPFSTSLGRNSASRIEILVVVLGLRSELDVRVPGLRILEDFAFIIANHDFFVVVIKDVARINRHFPTAAGGVDYELWHSVTGGVAAQPFDDLDPFRNGRAQM